MIVRLPKWAELAFESQCAAVGAIAHPPEEDQNGWDYLVEFPPQKHKGPADTHPPPKSAYVQIKSVRKRELTCRLTLSNSLKAAQSVQPWFLVLICANKKTSEAEIYAVHLWEDFMRRALKAVRQAENSGKSLNRSTLSVRFSQNDRRDKRLLPWMEGEISAVGSDYDQRKRSLYLSVGYESGHGVARTTISASSLDEMAINFLGLGDGLAVSEFSFTPSRFGLLSPKPEIECAEGKLIVTPNAVDTCEVRFRTKDFFYSLKGQVFTFGEPVVPREERRIRFSAEFFDLVMTTTDSLEAKIVSARIDPNAKRDLYVLEVFAAINECRQVGVDLDLQVWARGHCVVGGTMSLDLDEPLRVNWARLRTVIQKLRRLQAGSGHSVRVSLREIFEASHRLGVLTGMIDTPEFRLEFRPTDETPAKIDSLICYSFALVGDFLFFALFDAALKAERLVDERRQLDFETPKVVEAYVTESPSADYRQQLESEYQRYLKIRESQGHPAGISEMLDFANASRARGPIV